MCYQFCGNNYYRKLGLTASSDSGDGLCHTVPLSYDQPVGIFISRDFHSATIRNSLHYCNIFRINILTTGQITFYSETSKRFLAASEACSYFSRGYYCVYRMNFLDKSPTKTAKISSLQPKQVNGKWSHLRNSNPRPADYKSRMNVMFS